jgi:uncharacterized membrane protein
MTWQINGLPLHPLLVHFVVVLLPLAALMLILGSVWPAARRKFGVLTPIVALAGLIVVPLATQAGEALERQIEESAAVERHTELGDHLLPWAIGLFLIALAQWLWFRWSARRDDEADGGRRRPIVNAVLAVAAIAIALGSVIDVVQIGEAGAQAVWSNSDAPSDQAR